MSESKIEKKACALVWKHLGIKGSKLNIIGDTGYPDRIFWVPGGRPLMIEFKVPGGKSSPKQRLIHKQLKELGYRVEVHDNAINAFQAVIEAVDTTQLSEESLEILARASSICTLLRSGAREDSDNYGSDKLPEEKEDYWESASHCTAPALLRSVAGRDKAVEGLQRFKDSDTSRPEEE